MKLNTFNTKHLNDLPKKLRNIVKIPAEVKIVSKLQKGTQDILDLFALKNPLTVNEILVGLYRKYKVTKTLPGVLYTLKVLQKKKLVKRKSKGVYVKA